MEIRGELDHFTHQLNKLEKENDYLQQWRIDNDLLLSGFSALPNTETVVKKTIRNLQFCIK
jgi:hypothetical protein